MATVPNRPDQEPASETATGAQSWARGPNAVLSVSDLRTTQEDADQEVAPSRPTQQDALQALLAFSALHDQVRRRKALAARYNGFDVRRVVPEFEASEQFLLDEVLQLVAERAVAITGADGLAIALAENNEIVLRASAGTVRPDVGARIDRDSAFSGASFRTAQIVICDDTETDSRVNLQACRRLGARSMVAVPLCGRKRVIGLLEAFSTWPFAFNDSDVRNLSLLAELIVGALKPEDEDRFADSAQVAAGALDSRTVEAAPPETVVAQPTAPNPAREVPPTAAAPVLPAQAETPAPPAATSPAPAAKPAVPEFEPAAPAVSPAVEAPFTALRAVEPHLTFGQVEPERPRRTGLIVGLITVVIVAAFAAGLWWKWRMAQAGREMIGADKQATAASVSESQTAGPNASTGTQAPGGVANPASDMSVETSGAATTPASPTDLAKFPRVTGIRHWSSADSTTIVLDLEDQVQYEAHRLTGPDRIYFDLHDTQLAPEIAGKSIEVGDEVLNRIRVAQPVSGMTRIVLETKANPNFSVSLEPNPYRLVVEVRKIGATPKGNVNLFPNPEAEKSRMAIVVPPPTKEDLQWRAHAPKMRIVVDAGHGGWDLGTVGRGGLLEKDLVLEIGERLGKLLESRLGMEVIYTRQDDNYIPLDERAEIANQAQADLFVSVHANYSDLPSARGVETYYTNQFSAPGSKDAAKDADAHASMTKGTPTPTLTSADLRERSEQSRHLAASVQRSLYGTLSAENSGLRDRGIKEAGFVVLTESAMPGILAEVSFVSSPTDEQKLRSDGYRERIAEALYRGIARYAVDSRTVKVASARK